MAFLSLGLHNDEPPASSDQGKKAPVPEREAPKSSRAPLSLGLTSAEKRPPAAGNGNGAEHPDNGNGHLPVNEFSSADDFDADKFEDDLDSSASAAQLKSWMSTAAEALKKPVQPANGNGRMWQSPPTQSALPKDIAPTQAALGKNVGPAPSLPPSVELLRRKLEAEERQRVSRLGPAPLAASVDSLSAAERQWVPTFSTFPFGYLPGRGLLFSTIGHEVVIFGLFLLVTYVIPTMHPSKLIDMNNAQDHVILLPELGGGSEGEKSPGAGESTPKQAAAAPARASKGFAYPGKQAILSNPPNPTNTFQTIQRPLLVNPELIKKLVPAPNIVKMAETRLPSDLLAAKPALPQLKDVPKPIRVKQDTLAHREAKFDVPTDAPKLNARLDMPKLPAAELPLPEAPNVLPQPKQEQEKREVETPSPIKVANEKRTEKPQREVSPLSAAQVARLEMHGRDKEPVLSLSPMPLPDGPDAKLPNGEARGKFAIAPGGTLNPTSITPGKANGEPSTTPGTGQQNAKAPNAAGSEAASNSGSPNGKGVAGAGGPGHSTVASGTGTSGIGGGSGSTSGAGTGGVGTGTGHGNTGKGAGAAGDKQGAGSGAGAGSGSGSGSFPGITIQGAQQAEAQAKPAKKPAFTIEPQTSYNMTIVSTASSGGGLEDFGVFKNERIFTVYIPVKPSPELADPTWTMQYAVIKDASVPDAGSQQVVPPSVAVSEWPKLPPALEKKYSHHQVVIYAEVGKDGKVSQVSVKRTPDPRVSDPIAAVLKKWVFHPAQVNNEPTSVKILLGIPLT